MTRLIKTNDNDALSELYTRYSSKLLGFFIKMFKGDIPKSQDFLQDVFVKIIDKKHQFDTSKKFYTWVFTIASNMCKTEFRKPIIKVISTVDHSNNVLFSVDDDNFDKKLFKKILKEKVHELEYHHKSVFILRFSEQFSMKDIADITEVSLGTVKSRLFYATKKIAEQLKEYNPKQNNNFFKSI